MPKTPTYFKNMHLHSLLKFSLSQASAPQLYVSDEPPHQFKKGTVHHVVGDEKTTVTMVLNKNLWLEINANTSSNERMPARHRSLWRDWLCSLQFVSVLYSSHKYPQLNNGYGSFFATYNMVHCSLCPTELKNISQNSTPPPPPPLGSRKWVCDT